MLDAIQHETANLQLWALFCTCCTDSVIILQVLNIPTKINKGTVEITSNVALIKAGEKVGASEATLLAKLGIKPFSYGLIVQHVSNASYCAPTSPPRHPPPLLNIGHTPVCGCSHNSACSLFLSPVSSVKQMPFCPVWTKPVYLCTALASLSQHWGVQSESTQS